MYLDLASIFPGCAYVIGKFSANILIACNANPSVIGVAFTETYASIA